MGFAITEIESTPNPDALLFQLDRPICEGTISIGERSVGIEDDATIASLRGIEGVAGLMFRDSFLTVRKEAGADCGPIRAKVKRVLKDADRLVRAGF
jgi:hypothetical protein